MIDYPEHEKLEKVQKIGEFLEWATSKGFRLCEWIKKEGGDDDANEYMPTGYYPVNININDLLVLYFNIDLKELEKEKRSMLGDLRNKSKED